MTMHDSDLIINIGARFDDRITGKIDEFSPKSKKVHIDIDPSSINKIIKLNLKGNMYHRTHNIYNTYCTIYIYWRVYFVGCLKLIATETFY